MRDFHQHVCFDPYLQVLIKLGLQFFKVLLVETGRPHLFTLLP
jgi:hypothetical protein